jgi:hypothetical protein
MPKEKGTYKETCVGVKCHKTKMKLIDPLRIGDDGASLRWREREWRGKVIRSKLQDELWRKEGLAKLLTSQTGDTKWPRRNDKGKWWDLEFWGVRSVCPMGLFLCQLATKSETTWQSNTINIETNENKWKIKTTLLPYVQTLKIVHMLTIDNK